MSHKHGHEADDGQSESKAYETRDVKLRPLVVFIAGLPIVGIVRLPVVSLMLIGLFGGQAAREDAQVAPSSCLEARAAFRARNACRPSRASRRTRPPTWMRSAAQEDAILTTYGWVDRQAGVVRIPIDVAMQQVLEEGLPVRQRP